MSNYICLILTIFILVILVPAPEFDMKLFEQIVTLVKYCINIPSTRLLGRAGVSQTILFRSSLIGAVRNVYI